MWLAQFVGLVVVTTFCILVEACNATTNYGGKTVTTRALTSPTTRHKTNDNSPYASVVRQSKSRQTKAATVGNAGHPSPRSKNSRESPNASPSRTPRGNIGGSDRVGEQILNLVMTPGAIDEAVSLTRQVTTTTAASATGNTDRSTRSGTSGTFDYETDFGVVRSLFTAYLQIFDRK